MEGQTILEQCAPCVLIAIVTYITAAMVIKETWNLQSRIVSKEEKAELGT